jgi:mannose-6-phosphate isomerase-like protein (cupin superfamily)
MENLMPIYEADNKVLTYSIFPDNENRHFAVYYVEVQPKAFWESSAHITGTAEFIIVHEGEFTVSVNNENTTIRKNECFRFRSDVKHLYSNFGNNKALLTMIVYNTKKI